MEFINRYCFDIHFMITKKDLFTHSVYWLLVYGRSVAIAISCYIIIILFVFVFIFIFSICRWCLNRFIELRAVIQLRGNPILIYTFLWMSYNSSSCSKYYFADKFRLLLLFGFFFFLFVRYYSLSFLFILL